MTDRALFIPLRREWFELFESRQKTTEWRVHGPRWNEKTCWPGRTVVLSLGYGKQRRLFGKILTAYRVEALSPDHPFHQVYGTKTANAVAFAIQIELRPL